DSTLPPCVEHGPSNTPRELDRRHTHSQASPWPSPLSAPSRVRSQHSLAGLARPYAPILPRGLGWGAVLAAPSVLAFLLRVFGRRRYGPWKPVHRERPANPVEGRDVALGLARILCAPDA